MCLRFCELWTWRISSCFISVVCATIGFIYGPLHTVMYFTDHRPETAELLQRETNWAVFLWFLVGVMWFVFLSSVLLFLACLNRSIRLVNVYIVLTIVHMIVSFAFCLRYLVYCTVFDKVCFDHTPREDDDIGAALIVMVANLIYTIGWFVVLFAVCNFKLTLE